MPLDVLCEVDFMRGEYRKRERMTKEEVMLDINRRILGSRRFRKMFVLF